MVALTWVDFSVVPHTICLDNILEARGEFIGPYKGGRWVLGWDAVHKRRNSSTTFSLQEMKVTLLVLVAVEIQKI